MSATEEPSDAVTRHEEELLLETKTVDAGMVRAHKHVTSEAVAVPTTRHVEHLGNVERVPPNEQDSGQIETLEDGSISIPILEEELVVTKRVVVRERVILQKRVTTEHRLVEADLRSEQLRVEPEGPAPGEPADRHQARVP
jgi:uncharacterized protein (TIGR02271 family)